MEKKLAEGGTVRREREIDFGKVRGLKYFIGRGGVIVNDLLWNSRMFVRRKIKRKRWSIKSVYAQGMERNGTERQKDFISVYKMVCRMLSNIIWAI